MKLKTSENYDKPKWNRCREVGRNFIIAALIYLFFILIKYKWNLGSGARKLICVKF